MSTVLKSYESHLDAVLAQGESLANSGPEWLSAIRTKGLRTFSEHGVPTTKAEEWKYTPLRDFAETTWTVATVADVQETPSFEDGAIKVLLVNGRFVRCSEELPPGLAITSLAKAVTEESAAVQTILGQCGSKTTETFDREIHPDIYPFGALNDAVFEDGLLIQIESGAAIDRLIEVVHAISRTDGATQSVSSPRILIDAGAGSTAKIVEWYVSDGCDPDAVVAVTEVRVAETANLEHIRVQSQCACSTHIGLWQTTQAKDSTYTAFNVCFGGALARLDQSIWIGGEGCTTRLDGVACANGKQHMDNHTRLDHAVPNCNSFEIYKQVIDDSATVVFNGKIFVHQDAQKTDAKQTNQALLLSPTATIDSKPQLEIFADDVKCTHGATVGQLEDTPMFYMRSRGVPKDEAQAVLVYAFAAEVLELISVDSVRMALERKLYQKLGVDLT